MKTICEKVQSLLSEGEDFGSDFEAKEHVLHCSECKTFKEALKSLEKTFENSTFDASDQLVSNILARVKAETSKARSRFSVSIPWLLALGLALLVLFVSTNDEALVYLEGTFGALCMLACIGTGIYLSFTRRFRLAGSFVTAGLCMFVLRSIEGSFFNDTGVQDGIGGLRSFSSVTKSISNQPTEAYQDLTTRFSGGGEAPAIEEKLKEKDSKIEQYNKYEQRSAEIFRGSVDKLGTEISKDVATEPQSDSKGFGGSQLAPPFEENEFKSQPETSAHSNVYDLQKKVAEPAPAKSLNQKSADIELGQTAQDRIDEEMLDQNLTVPSGNRSVSVEIDATSGVEGFVQPGTRVDVVLSYIQNSQLISKVIIQNVRVLSYLNTPGEAGKAPRRSVTLELQPLDALKIQTARQMGKISLILRGNQSTQVVPVSPTPLPTPQINGFLPSLGIQYVNLVQRRSSLDGLVFQNPHGYWANTYIPGDPSLKRLESKLSASEFSQIRNLLEASHLSLHDLAARAELPVDTPSNSSIGISMHSDKTQISGKTRMLLQVGIKAVPGQQGTRQAMKVALVLDLRVPPNVEQAEKLKNLIRAFERARTLGDQFTLVVSGVEGGIVIRPGELRFGTSEAAIQKLFSNKPTERGGLTLSQAIQVSIGALTENSDSQGLGSTHIWVASAQGLGNEKEQIFGLAAQAAVAGMSVSAIDLGCGGQNSDELEELALSGQGSKRILNSALEASQLIADELESASRVVARALRLNIKLAPNVKLVEVIGSKRLDTQQVTEVKALETSIDRKISKQLGIEADRGDDEDGIQIVIPRFLSGDYHTILLDVVADEPGPIAEVSARFKDVVYLKNNQVRSSFIATNGTSFETPSERMVLNNYLAQEFSKALQVSGTYLSSGNVTQAKLTLENHLALLENLESDTLKSAVGKDYEMVKEYLTALTRVQNPEDIKFIAYSMNIAAKRKIQSPLEI